MDEIQKKYFGKMMKFDMKNSVAWDSIEMSTNIEFTMMMKLNFVKIN